MRCPNCNAEMEPGELDLKARGIGVSPQAQLHFNDVLLLTNNSIPVVGAFTGGTKAPAFRCRVCQMVCFQYVIPNQAPESVVSPRLEPVPNPGNA